MTNVNDETMMTESWDEEIACESGGDEYVATAARCFEPLVRAAARKYEGRGAELEDLEQEGRLAVMRAARRIGARELTRFLARAVPTAVRDAAEVMTRRGRPGKDSRLQIVSLSAPTGMDDDEELGDLIEDARTAADFVTADIVISLEMCATQVDRETAEALMRGASVAEIAAEAGVSPQTVSMRLKRLGRKIAAEERAVCRA